MKGVDGFNGAKIDCLLFDLDDTLYPLSSGINLACCKNIEEYMLNRLHIVESQVPKMCLDLYKEHGTTMAGLKAIGYDFDDDEFHEIVHGSLPYQNLTPDPVLRNLLLSIPHRKIIFTNSDKGHVERALKRLGLEDCFEGIICFETLNPKSNSPSILCKPSVEAMEAAVQIADVRPHNTMFFDDSARNIASAKAVGLRTVGRSTMVEGADHALSSIHNLKEALPQIWQTQQDQQQQAAVLIQSSAIETVVLA
ncbi:hypothetical protein V2J09_018557 [Rumex salicifolius]